MAAANFDEHKRRQNERKYKHWEDMPEGGRRYWFEVPGRSGWSARYVKDVDESEVAIRFYQEIFDQNGTLVEIHQKYPEDTGHQAV